MSENPELGALMDQVREAEAKQQKRAQESEGELSGIYQEGKKISTAKESAKGLNLTETAEGLEAKENELKATAKNIMAEPGVKDKVLETAKKEMITAEADKIREESRKELGILAQRLYAELLELVPEFKKAEEANKQRIEEAEAMRKATIGFYEAPAIRVDDKTIDEAMSAINNESKPQDQIAKELAEYRSSLGLFDGKKKKAIDYIIENMHMVAESSKLNTDARKEFYVIHSGNWSGFDTFKKDLDAALEVSANYQKQIDDTEGTQYTHDLQKHMLITPLRLSVEKNGNAASILSGYVREILEERGN